MGGEARAMAGSETGRAGCGSESGTGGIGTEAEETVVVGGWGAGEESESEVEEAVVGMGVEG